MKTATKMYLSVILSTLCIMFYQYQLSKANFISTQRNGNNAIISDSAIISGNSPLVCINHYSFIIILSIIRHSSRKPNHSTLNQNRTKRYQNSNQTLCSRLTYAWQLSVRHLRSAYTKFGLGFGTFCFSFGSE